ncbi:MAG: hypothetical protein QXI16_07085 [Sulfolobaceae archaeon]
MSVQFIGYERIAGEKSKKTGEPFDYTKVYLLSDESDKVSGYEPMALFLSTAELQKTIGVVYNELPNILGSEVKLKFGMYNGKPNVVGFDVDKSADTLPEVSAV